MGSIDDIAPESSGDKPIGLQLKPGLPLESGEGFPYASENWPLPGDMWRWKVGQRVTLSGYFMDRYLYLPQHLHRVKARTHKRQHIFASKLAVERYVSTEFPDADNKKFFDLFSWKIPCKVKPSMDDAIMSAAVPLCFCCLRALTFDAAYVAVPLEHTLSLFLPRRTDEDSLSESPSNGAVCVAGNRKYLLADEENPPLAAMPCNICCDESHFCHQCFILFCCKTVSLEHGGFGCIRCETVQKDSYICGHVAHVNCALGSYMARTVGGSIGLDAEYYCRRCDSKTDLISHVRRCLEVCESINSKCDVEKLLNVCICMLRFLRKNAAKELMNQIESNLQQGKMVTSK